MLLNALKISMKNKGKKIGIITQVRMASTRLPGKVMLPIKGKPMLWFFLENLNRSNIPIYIATSLSPSNDIIADFARENNVAVFRGDENNVLSRYYQCARENKLDVIVRVTSDCPLIDGRMVADAVSRYMAFDNESVYFSNCVELTFPHGLNFEVFSFKLLEEAYKHATTDFQKEHVTPYIIQNVSGNVILKHYTREKNDSRYRLTVDTYEDFLLVKKLIEEYGAQGNTADKIVSIFEAHPELVLINIPKKPHIWGTG